MELRITMEAIITFPEGTTVPEEGRGFTLPGGDWVKPWIVMELNDDRDLTFMEAQALGVDVCETNIEWEEL